MSRLVTQLVTDEPAVVLVGEPTLLNTKLQAALSQKQVAVFAIKPSDISQNTRLLQSAYKVLWVCDYDNVNFNYSETAQQLAQIKSQLIVIMPVFSSIQSGQSNVLATWIAESKKQEQAIIDCNYYLPSASFIFGENCVGNTTDATLFTYILSQIEKQIILDPLSEISFLSLEDFISQIITLIFVPNKQISCIVTGKSYASTYVLGQIKKIYDVYHAVSVEIIQDKPIFAQTVPFSVTEKRVASDVRALTTYLVKQLPAPSREEQTSQTAVVPPVSYRPEFSAVQQASPTPVAQVWEPVVREPIVQEQAYPTPLVQNQVIQQSITQAPVVQEPSTQTRVVHSQRAREPVIQEPAIKSSGIHSPIAQQLVTQQPESTVVPAAKKQNEVDDLTTEIQKIFKDTRTEQKVERVENIVKSTKKIAKKSKSRTKLFYGGLLSIGMAIGIIILVFIYTLSGFVLKRQAVSFLSHATETEISKLQPSFVTLKLAQFVGVQTTVYSQLLELSILAQNSVVAGLIQEFQTLPEVLSQADKASKNLVINILRGSTGNTKELTEILTQSVSEAYEKLSLMQATLEQSDFTGNSEKQAAVIKKISTTIQELRHGFEIHQQLQQVLPDMVGMSGKRTYALLLQNNQELRSTGGFIQAVALLNFIDGSLVSYQVYSVYELDKKLPGQVVPPEEIKLLLGEQNWYLRDSNWDPDFPKTSEQVTWFIEKSLGVTVDGVIGMTVYSLEDLLQATGPINLPEYNEVLTEKNIEERMEFHSEVVLVDSPEAVDYSVKVVTKVLDGLSALKEESVPTLLSALNHSFETKQAQIYSKVPSEQSIFQGFGWTGTLAKPACPSRLSVVTCLVDSISQVEINIGVNKANYYLKRTIDHVVEVSPTEAKHTRKVMFTNTAGSNAWPKGTYKTLLKFYVNPESKLETVMINGAALTTNQVAQIQENGFLVFGVRVDVPIQKEVQVDLVYSTPLVTEGSFSYVFYNRKQSGLKDDPFSVKIQHTPDIKPVLIAPSAALQDNNITFSAKTLDDASLFGVKFE